jgi:hypothetical protein
LVEQGWEILREYRGSRNLKIRKFGKGNIGNGTGRNSEMRGGLYY